ncbi:hypothetical protein IGI04_003534 [Brassica rapa subsp. trilocularis]|uniref:Uncharacterized protein n=1 Tax=Brassica rapa subsp. trilocularis TaxID=1813537 RepID=A0ABQ7NYQ4_BRACM|nr:hypothetical protein IGI04_003534 [Brassica rapa subsp. trilocularis]
MELCGSGINKEHQMCSKTFGYERIKDLSENVFRLKKISRWRLMWRKIMMGMKHKKKDQVLDHCFRYDPFTYSQNFENDGTIAYHEDPDVSSKSFSARFVSSSKVFTSSNIPTEQICMYTMANKSIESQSELKKRTCGRMFLLVSVLSELNSAKEVVTGLGQELSSDKKLSEELRAQIESLQSSLSKAGEDEKALETELRDKLDLIEGLQDRINLLSLELKDKKEESQRVSTSLAEKEAEVEKLNSAYTQTSRDLADAIVEIKQVKEEVTRTQIELDSESFTINELNTRISTLEGEEKSYTQKLDDERREQTVQASRDSVSDLEKLLGESRALCSKFEPEVSVIRGEFDEAKERYEEKRAEERRNSEVLAKELAVEKDLLKKARDELEVEEAVKSLDEMNKNTSTLTKELEKMNTHVSSLEDEKEVLQRTLEEANKASKKAKENMEGAYSFLMSLRKERGVIEKKVKKLEEDLGSAKGEILRMRSQPNSVKAENSTEDEEKSDDKVTAKKVVRRRKSSTSS